jgi:hypothetical protein
MYRYVGGFLFSGSILLAGIASADNVGDPVRKAQMQKDCVAQQTAQNDGSTPKAIRKACRKSIADGTFNDKNISLDGMIRHQNPSN